MRSLLNPDVKKVVSTKDLWRKFIKYSVVIHRYLGIVFGFVILLWCLSGFVMMFVQYPSLSHEERYHYMAPLQLGSCCQLPRIKIFGEENFNSFSLTQSPAGPLLKLNKNSEARYFDAVTGVRTAGSTPESRFAEAKQIAFIINAGQVLSLGISDVDQWSVIPSVAKHAPFEIFELGDDHRTRLYFSLATGELVQEVSFNERTWGWVGSVIHWLYPTKLRSNAELWAQLVIWLSLISLFMVVVGAVLGVLRLRHRGKWRASPYRGYFLWHHYTSLFAGVLMLTWLFSGLMSMYPWGLMEGRSFTIEKQNLRGSGFALNSQLNAVFERIESLQLPEKTVEVNGVLVAGYLTLTAVNNTGMATLVERIAIDGLGENAFPSAKKLANLMRPNENVLSVDYLNSGDRYYYNHHTLRAFPVYRIIYEDGERIYLDGLSFDVNAVFDQGRKTARWLYLGLHRGDFFPNLNSGLYWYLVWGGFLAVMTFAVIIGCWLAIRRWQRMLTKKSRQSIRVSK